MPNTTVTQVQSQPVRSDLPPIYCYVELDDAFRMQHIDDPEYGFAASERYGLHPTWRLLALGVRGIDFPVPEVAYEGFVWCGFGAKDEIPTPNELQLQYSWLGPNDRCHVAQVKLNRQNNVYICDHAAFLKKRAEISEAMPAGSDRFTQDQVSKQHLARARTLVHVSEYDFTKPYEQPLVLIERDLDLDEVEILTGPWRHKKREWQLVPDES